MRHRTPAVSALFTVALGVGMAMAFISTPSPRVPTVLSGIKASRCAPMYFNPLLAHQRPHHRTCLSSTATEDERAGADMPADYWESPDNVVKELKAFLKVREAKEAEKLSQTSASKGMWRFLGVYDQEEKGIRGRESVVDRQLYGELKRYGFEYLILPVMAIGGIFEVQQLLKEPSEEEVDTKTKKPRGLMLGSALEDLLAEELANGVTFKETDPSEAASSSSTVSRVSMQRRSTLGSQESEEEDQESDKDDERDASPSIMWSDLSLTNGQKLYMTAASMLLALGLGKSTAGAMERGHLPPSLFEGFQVASQVVIAANAISVPASVALLVKDGAPGGQAFPYAAKSLVAGPLALLEIRERSSKQDFPHQRKQPLQ